MSTWRVHWALAQVTSVLFSTLVWILLMSASPLAAVVALVVGAALVAGRDTAPGLWWRFGARLATPRDEERIVAALAPIVGLRGRNQPQVWVGRRTWGGAVITGRHLVIDERLLDRPEVGTSLRLAICTTARRALALREITSSAVVAMVAVYSLPWLIAEEIWRRGAAGVAAVPLLPLVWRSRWLAFAITIVQSWQAGRWAVSVLVAGIAALSWSTGVLRGLWVQTLVRLGDQSVGFALGHAHDGARGGVVVTPSTPTPAAPPICLLATPAIGRVQAPSSSMSGRGSATWLPKSAESRRGRPNPQCRTVVARLSLGSRLR